MSHKKANSKNRKILQQDLSKEEIKHKNCQDAETAGGQIAADKFKDIKMYAQNIDPDQKEMESIISHGEGELFKRLEDDEKIVYSFESKQRCGKCFSIHTKSGGTMYDRTTKRWRCLKCPHTWKTVGKKI